MLESTHRARVFTASLVMLLGSSLVPGCGDAPDATESAQTVNTKTFAIHGQDEQGTGLTGCPWGNIAIPIKSPRTSTVKGIAFPYLRPKLKKGYITGYCHWDGAKYIECTPDELRAHLVGALIASEYAGPQVTIQDIFPHTVAGQVIPDQPEYEVKVVPDWTNPSISYTERVLLTSGPWTAGGAAPYPSYNRSLYASPLGGFPPDIELNVVTLACAKGVIHKCMDWGYRPWDVVGTNPMEAYHAACTRMARADYGGNGAPCTRDGTEIVFGDTLDKTAFGLLPAGFSLEAKWGVGGPVCIGNHHRYPRTYGGQLAVPSCDDLAPDDPRVLIVNYSSQDNSGAVLLCNTVRD